VAHGRFRQEREADAVADRIADEGGQRDARASNALADVDESELVVAGEDQVVGCAAQQGKQQMADAEARERGLQIAIADPLQLAAQDPERRAQQHGGERRRQPAAQPGVLAGLQGGTHIVQSSSSRDRAPASSFRAAPGPVVPSAAAQRRLSI